MHLQFKLKMLRLISALHKYHMREDSTLKQSIHHLYLAYIQHLREMIIFNCLNLFLKGSDDHSGRL